MLPKLKIEQKIEEQKPILLNRLIVDTKFSVSDIKKISFNRDTYNGVFEITIDGIYKQALQFHYENNKFNWGIESIEMGLRSLWSDILDRNKSVIEQKIQDDLGINIENAMKVSCGLKNIVYVYEENSLEPITIVCEFIDNDRIVRRQ